MYKIVTVRKARLIIGYLYLIISLFCIYDTISSRKLMLLVVKEIFIGKIMGEFFKHNLRVNEVFISMEGFSLSRAK